jgi:hypothetical protein
MSKRRPKSQVNVTRESVWKSPLRAPKQSYCADRCRKSKRSKASRLRSDSKVQKIIECAGSINIGSFKLAPRASIKSSI